ncbi:MAG: hypothetical protein ACREGK_11310, partial [Geminicoccales bacterium]
MHVGRAIHVERELLIPARAEHALFEPDRRECERSQELGEDERLLAGFFGDVRPRAPLGTEA